MSAIVTAGLMLAGLLAGAAVFMGAVIVWGAARLSRDLFTVRDDW